MATYYFVTMARVQHPLGGWLVQGPLGERDYLPGSLETPQDVLETLHRCLTPLGDVLARFEIEETKVKDVWIGHTYYTHKKEDC